jgi:hypothetical protein
MKASASINDLRRSSLWLAAAALVVGAPMVWFAVTPDPVLTFCAVRLGMLKEDVRYRLGSPLYVFDVVGSCPNGGQHVYATAADDENPLLPRGRTDASYDDWAYGDTDNHHYQDIYFRRGAVAGIACYDFEGFGRHCPALLGVQTGDSEAEVLRRFGAPDAETLDSGIKSMRYARWNISIRLEKRRVYGLIVGAMAQPTSLRASL